MELIKVAINDLDILKTKLQNFQTPFVATIGVFDGMHLYHQKILKKTKQWAVENKMPMLVISFSQNIFDYLNNQDNRITTTIQKAVYIEQTYNADLFIEIQTNNELITTSKETFIELLKNTFKVSKLVEGTDFRFGSNGEGNVESLQTAFGFENVWVESRANEISSTKIRKLLKEGYKDKANKLLGIKVK